MIPNIVANLWVLNKLDYTEDTRDLHEVPEDVRTWLAHSRDLHRQHRNHLEVPFR